MRQALFIFAAATLLVLSRAPEAATGSIPARDDEFVGPFPSWSNVKTVYGAVGDGNADDTAAIQTALNELGTSGHSPVLFVPHGTYRITKTLVLAYNINVSIVGEDPATTTVVWDGEVGGTMLWINGVAYSRFDRLSFDGRRRASVAVEQSWDNARPHFDSGNQYADDYFTDVEYGIHGGFKGFGFAETSVRRARFTRNSRAGIALGNFNALDLWVWYSIFDNCYTGVTNTMGAGNFHVYNSVFRRSTSADLSIGNTGGFSARGNYSIGSRTFFTGAGTNNPALIDIQANTIVDPVESTAIRFGNQGPGWIADNVIRSLPDAVAPVVSWVSFIDADVMSIGNIFTVSLPIRSNGRLTHIDDRTVARSVIRPREPSLAAAPSSMGRQVFEVPTRADAGTIQNAIIAAARQNGRRSIVHLPHATYSIAETITVPASDVQLVGDGYGTILRWTGTGAGPVLRLLGPSTATLRELQVDGSARADGIVIETTDQSGARVYMDQAQLRSGRATDLLVDGLDNANVQLEDIGYAYSPNAVSSIRVTGGRLAAAGRQATGRTNVFSGASSGHRISYDVSGGATVLVRDVWYEGGAGPGFANVHDAAVFTLDGARLATPAAGNPAAFNITNLNGRVAILSADIEDRISIAGSGSNSQVLALGLMAERRSSDYFVNAASPPAIAALINSRQLSILPGNRSGSTTNVGSADPSFLRAMLNHARTELPRPLTALPLGVSDVRLFRVWAANGLNNVTITAGTTTGASLDSKGSGGANRRKIG